MFTVARFVIPSGSVINWSRIRTILANLAHMSRFVTITLIFKLTLLTIRTSRVNKFFNVFSFTQKIPSFTC